MDLDARLSDIAALRRVALIGVALAIMIGSVSTIAGIAAFGWDFEAALFGDPMAILGRGPEAALLFRWAFLGDMFYSYLLLAPLALFLHRRLRERRPWLADLGLLSALAYIVLGGAGAAILATAGSSLIEAYAGAAPADRPAIATAYELVRNIVYFALWQTIDAINLGTWVLSTGLLVLPDRPLLGRFLITLGPLGWAAAVMTMLDVHSVAAIGAALLLCLASWLGWTVISRSRRRRVEPRAR